MFKQFSIAQIFLWLFVIALGITLGAGLYETMVVMPLWDTTPPGSVIAYHQHNVANPQFALNLKAADFGDSICHLSACWQSQLCFPV